MEIKYIQGPCTLRDFECVSVILCGAGEYLPSYGRGSSGVSGLCGVSPPPQHPGLFLCVRLLSQHLPDRPQPLISAGTRRNLRCPTHGHPHLH